MARHRLLATRLQRGGVALTFFLAALSPAFAGLPRGAMLTADEQTGDETAGSTIARGHAELTVPDYKIAGRADVIEIWSQRNEIRFNGTATLSVGTKRFFGDSVVCTLDFYSCRSEPPAGDQPEISGALGTAVTRPE